MTRGSVPLLASDMFTCGLILYELLAGAHPYWRDDQAEYATLVKAYAAKPPALLGALLDADRSSPRRLSCRAPRADCYRYGCEPNWARRSWGS